MDWIQKTLQMYPEIAILLSIGLGYWFGGKSYKGFSLGSVTATLIVAIIIGQLDISITGPVKSIFFLMFLFAIGYGLGPQFIRGLARDGAPQAIFAVVQCIFSLFIIIIIAKIAGYNVGQSAGLFAGSQTMSASMGLATDAINRQLTTDVANIAINSMPVAYAVSYIFGTVGSAIILTYLGPLLMRVDIVKACQDYEKQNGADANGSDTIGWHQYELRAYSLAESSGLEGATIKQFENKYNQHTVFIEKIIRDNLELNVQCDTTLKVGDILVIGGNHKDIVDNFSQDLTFIEVDDSRILSIPVEGVSVFLTSRELNGKTLHEIADLPETYGVFIREIKRGVAGTSIPILKTTKIYRGDILTLSGATQDVERFAKKHGHVDRHTNVADVAFIGVAIAIGAVIGAVVINIGGIPITLSTAGGALVAGIVFGWIRSIHPKFGYIPEPTVWFMNSVGLNVFIAVVGITSGMGFIAGLKEAGISLFIWGMVATSAPLILGVLVGRYIFKFHPALVLGCCAGSRTTTAALGMVCERAKSNIPALGYTVTYAVGNVFLTIWGMVIVMILT